jgi:hypothetical protein
MAYDMDWLDSRLRGLWWPAQASTYTLEERELAPWRYVWGAPGTGTTAQLALAVRYYVVEHGRSAILLSEHNLIESLKPGQQQRSALDYIDASLLAVDRVCSFGTEWGGTQVLNILDERRRRHKPTLIGSHKDLTTMERHTYREGTGLGGQIAAVIFGATGSHRTMIHLTQQRRGSWR